MQERKHPKRIVSTKTGRKVKQLVNSELAKTVGGRKGGEAVSQDRNHG